MMRQRIRHGNWSRNNSVSEPYTYLCIAKGRFFMMKRLLTLVLVLASFNASSQQGKVTLRFCPLALADEISFPTIQGGVQETGLV
jgi:hypothetical protein